MGDLHNSSLLIDDIEDNSKLRRGIPVAHTIFGVPTVINCANYVFFLALEKCHAWDNPDAMKVMVVVQDPPLFSWIDWFLLVLRFLTMFYVIHRCLWGNY